MSTDNCKEAINTDTIEDTTNESTTVKIASSIFKTITIPGNSTGIIC